MTDPTRPHEMQQVQLTPGGVPFNVGWMSAATDAQLDAEWDRAYDGWAFAAERTGDGGLEMRQADAIFDERQLRDGVDPEEVAQSRERMEQDRAQASIDQRRAEARLERQRALDEVRERVRGAVRRLSEPLDRARGRIDRGRDRDRGTER